MHVFCAPEGLPVQATLHCCPALYTQTQMLVQLTKHCVYVTMVSTLMQRTTAVVFAQKTLGVGVG
eukprot:1958786-Rhodomonas_salina.1